MVCQTWPSRRNYFRIYLFRDDRGKIINVFIYLLFFQKYVKAMLKDEPVEVKTIEVEASENDQKYNGGKKTKVVFSKYQ